MRYTIKTFSEFLNSVDLGAYKDLYSPIKIVEMDLPKDIQALNTIYDVYWNDNNSGTVTPKLFDEFYEEYFENCKNEINEFWNKSGFEKNCNCFMKGLKARIYRTWASLITQIHAGYVAESVFGKGSVEMSTELDHKGVDILVHYKGQDIKFQIKKNSKRREIARMNLKSKTDDIKDLWYLVPQESDYKNPYYIAKNRAGELRDSLKMFKKFNENGTLDRLKNGFVVFTEKEFQDIKNEIDGKKIEE